jgi:hypothetical protein
MLMANECENVQITLITKEMLMKLQYGITPITSDQNWKDNIKCWQGYGATGTLTLCWC